MYTDIVAILRREIEDLAAEGVSYIQIDAPRYTYFLDERWRQVFRDQGEDPDLIIDEWIDADNASFSGLDMKGATLAMHLCRGINRGSWCGECDYAPIAEKIFNAIDVDGFLLEFDGDRSGGYESLRFMPRDKTVLLGLVTIKTGPPEKIDDLLRRTGEPSAPNTASPPFRRKPAFLGAATPQTGVGRGDGSERLGIVGRQPTVVPSQARMSNDWAARLIV